MSYISVDRDRMVFLHKHEALDVVCNLNWIETRHAPVYIFCADDMGGYNHMTDMELKMLYRNTTGFDHNIENREALLQILYDLAHRLPANDVHVFELDAQARKIDRDDENFYMYCKGTGLMKTDTVDTLILKGRRAPKEEERALSGEIPAVIAGKERIAATNNDKRKRSKAKSKGKAGNGPARGTAKALIWKVADEMWNEEGAPKDKAEVLQLRRKIMDTLEEHGVKRASASSELGKWHKERIPD